MLARVSRPPDQPSAWWEVRDSNLRPPACKAGALTAELTSLARAGESYATPPPESTPGARNRPRSFRASPPSRPPNPGARQNRWKKAIATGAPGREQDRDLSSLNRLSSPATSGPRKRCETRRQGCAGHRKAQGTVIEVAAVAQSPVARSTTSAPTRISPAVTSIVLR